MRNKYKWVYETSKKQFTILYVLYHQWYNKVTLQNALQLFEKYPKIIREICNTTTDKYDFRNVRQILYKYMRKLKVDQRRAKHHYMNEIRFNVVADWVYTRKRTCIGDLKETVLQFM